MTILRYLCALALVAGFTEVAPCQTGEAPTLDYAAVEQWPLPSTSSIGAPGPWNFGQVSGVAIKKNGNVLVLHRGARPIVEFTSSGKFVRSWGDDLFSEGKVFTLAPQFQTAGKTIHSGVYGAAGCASCGAHAIRVDPQGNIWVVDASGQVIYRMNQQGTVTMQLGTKGVSGTDRNTFNLPTDIAFAPDGSLYVSDGYANERVVKFSSNGKYLLEWGKRGSGDGEFTLPHNIAIDAQGRVYVTDREGSRLEVFDADGAFLQEWPGIGGISALFLTKDQKLWAGNGLFDLDGRLLGKLPLPAGPAHGLAVSEAGDVYQALLNGSVAKFVEK